MKCHKNPIPGREYLCFQTDNKYYQKTQCAKLESLNKFIDNGISIGSF